MAFTLRADFTQRGAITFTGNALGLSKDTDLNEAGVRDSIGAFTSLNVANQVSTFPPGTTLDWTLNGSDAVLDLPPDATILHAELIWTGSSSVRGESIIGVLDTPVTFNGPLSTITVTPDSTTSQSVPNAGGNQFYMRTQDVTAFISTNGAGTYSVEGVPATVSPTENFNNVAGWTLAVIYRDPAETIYRNLTLFLGITNVQAASFIDVPITGFGTPISGAFGVRLLASTLEGDANQSGDRFEFGPTIGSLQRLSGPNNRETNFFGSQINKNDGTLDMRGTFGNRNQNPALGGGNIVGGRQGIDITNVDATGTLSNSQTSAIARFTTANESYNPHTLAVQIDISAPVITMVKSAPATAELGSTFTYSVQMINTGAISANDVIFTDIIPTGLTFVSGTFRLNNSPMAGNPNDGILIGNIGPSGIATVDFDVVVEQQPVPNTIMNESSIDYTFVSVIGGPTLPGDSQSNEVSTVLTQIVAISIEKFASADTIQLGETLTYTLVITNDSDSDINNILVLDELAENVNLVEGSVVIDGNSAPQLNPETGITIITLATNQVVTISFDVVVESITCPLDIVNQASVTYIRNTIERTELSNEVVTTIINSQFKQLVFNEILTIPDQNPDVEDILNQSASIEVTSTRMVKTNISTSLDNQQLSEYKLIISGYLNYSSEYVALNSCQSVHSLALKKPFSTFIILNNNSNSNTSFDIGDVIEYQRAEILNNRNIFIYALVKIDVFQRS